MEAVSFPTLAPSVCVICESVPPETPFVDTLNNFAPGIPTKLNGRKYLCESCVRDAANALDLFEEATAPVQEQVDELTAQVEHLTAQNTGYEAIKAALDVLTAPVEAQPKVERVATAAAKASARKQAAADAQATVDEQAAAEAAGAERQKQLDQEAADARTAAAEAALSPSEVPGPDLTQTPAADDLLPPVTPVGQTPDPANEPKPGQVWDGTAWVDPPATA